MLPFMAELVAATPDLFPAGIKLFKAGCDGAVTLTQRQCACVLANAFLCTFPRRNDTRQGSEYVKRVSFLSQRFHKSVCPN